MTKKRRSSKPVSTLEKILANSGRGAMVPASATSSRNAVEITHHQLRTVESWANSFVARISSDPVRICTFLLQDDFTDLVCRTGSQAHFKKKTSAPPYPHPADYPKYEEAGSQHRSQRISSHANSGFDREER